MTKQSITKLVTCALMIALATVLSLVKIWQMPLGGSITLCSMFPIMFIAYHYGLKWGILTGFTYSLIQLLLDLAAIATWGLTAQIFVGSMFFDYLIPFTLLGLIAVFKNTSLNKKFVKGNIELGFLLGMILVVLIRLSSHVFSGTIFFATWMPEDWTNPLLYSIVYNASFILPDLFLCIVASIFVFKPLSKALNSFSN